MGKRVLVLGATGSIGSQTLDIIDKSMGDFIVAGVVANTSLEALNEIATRYNCPAYLTARDGKEGLREFIRDTAPDIAVNGVRGAQGLTCSMCVVEAGVDLALANKESIVLAHDIIMRTASITGARVIPVDSEHSALFHLIRQIGRANIDRVILTASGGPFRTLDSASLDKVTPEDAVQHPTWSMGQKISIDSATLANKGLEVIEAARLFNIDAAHIDVVIQKESIVHSMVRTKDGAVYAEMSLPDMRRPILSALEYPNIVESPLPPYDMLSELEEGEERVLSFGVPRKSDFPMLPLAYRALKEGDAGCIAYNASNEVAVQAFIDGTLGFKDIPRVVEAVLDQYNDTPRSYTRIEDVLSTDILARARAIEAIGKRSAM